MLRYCASSNASIGLKPNLLTSRSCINCLPRLLSNSKVVQAQVEDNTLTEADIVIPRKVVKDDLAVLKALSATHTKLPHVPNYNFIDDPMLLPHNAEKDAFISKAAGKRSAEYVIRNSNLERSFLKRPLHDWTIPVPTYGLKPRHRLPLGTVDGFVERIAARDVQDAVRSYRKLRFQGEELPAEVVRDYYHLLCFANCALVEKTSDSESPESSESPSEGSDSPSESSESPSEGSVDAEGTTAVGEDEDAEINIVASTDKRDDELFVEEKQFQFLEMKRGKGQMEDTWRRKGNFAAKMFENPRETTLTKAEKYEGLIRGMAKYGALQEAADLYEQMKRENIPISAHVFTVVAQCYCSFHYQDDVEARESKLMELAKEMQSAGVKPNLAFFELWMQATNQYSLRLKVLNEAIAIGLEPSLYMFFSAITSVQGSKNRQLNRDQLLHALLNYMQNKEFEVHSAQDFLCLPDLMKMVSYTDNFIEVKRSEDSKAAVKIYNITKIGKNHQFLRSSHRFQFYEMLLSLVAFTEDISVTMSIYDEIVPYTHSPTGTHFKNLLEAIDLYSAYQHLPKLYIDMTRCGANRFTDVMDAYFKLCHKALDQGHISIGPQVTSAIKGKLDAYRDEIKLRSDPFTRERYRPGELTNFVFNSSIWSSFIEICLKRHDFALAWEILALYAPDSYNFEGVLRYDLINLMINLSITHESEANALVALQVLASDHTPKLDEAKAKVKNHLPNIDDELLLRVQPKGWAERRVGVTGACGGRPQLSDGRRENSRGENNRGRRDGRGSDRGRSDGRGWDAGWKEGRDQDGFWDNKKTKQHSMFKKDAFHSNAAGFDD